jgi:lipopolysaccharide/colanic/teichoic acid biosynthesis glycosyltransferase
MFHYRRPFSQDLFLALANLAGWLYWWVYRHGYDLPAGSFTTEHWAYLCWAALSSALGLVILYWLDYFRPFKEFKFAPDALAFFVTQLVAGFICKGICEPAFSITFMPDREIFFGAVTPGVAAALVEGFNWWAKGKSSKKSSIYLGLLDGEIAQFKEIMQAQGWQKYYRILTQQEFDGALATDGKVDFIIISRGGTKDFLYHENILHAQVRGVMILDFRTLLTQMRGHIRIQETDIWSFLAGANRPNSFTLMYRAAKFYLEPVLAAIGLVLLLPLFAFVAVLIKFTSKGPVFYSQRRTGYLGADFSLIKFRTMRTDAEAGGIQWAGKGDSRVTSIGGFLRKARIDELPQLWNVLTGEMSFLGPRPERPEFYEIINAKIPAFKLRLLVRPGISGWAQLMGGYAASIGESERKLEYDLYYVQYMSARMDLLILSRTILTLLSGDSGQ